MDIISISILTSITLVIVATILLITFNIRLNHKRKKFSVLKVKQIGGVPLTEEERNFLLKNKNLRFPKNKKFRIRQTKKFSLKETKEKIINYFNKFNPLWHKKQYEKQIEDLKKQIKEAYDLETMMLRVEKEIVRYEMKKREESEKQRNKKSVDVCDFVDKKQKETKTKSLMTSNLAKNLGKPLSPFI